MNDYEKEKLREHWRKPGRLKALLEVLSLKPERSQNIQESLNSKKAVWLTGIGFDPAEMAQVYFMLEEDRVIVREEAQPEPAIYQKCTHPGPRQPCPLCQFRNQKIRDEAGVRYRLAKPISEY